MLLYNFKILQTKPFQEIYYAAICNSKSNGRNKKLNDSKEAPKLIDLWSRGYKDIRLMFLRMEALNAEYIYGKQIRPHHPQSHLNLGHLDQKSLNPSNLSLHLRQPEPNKH